ncbi:MAG: sigma factor-like helix-turn-helix DNA-binding protein [Pseudoramibacter sp.]
MHTINAQNEIEILKQELKMLRNKLARLQRQSGPRELRGGTSYCDADAIHADHHREAINVLEEILECKNDIDEIEKELNDLQAGIERVRECAESLKETDKKVVYLRDVCGLALVDIAVELDLSYGYVRNISQKYPRCDKKCDTSIEK